MNLLNFFVLILVFIFSSKSERWTNERISKYYEKFIKKRPLIGCNYIPSIAVNELEFWQEDTFDVKQIEWELNLAHDIGYNLLRVFLHNLVHKEDKEGYITRIGQFLDICEKHEIFVLFVFFDDCWLPSGKIGKQPDPVPGVHNSQWLQAPETPHEGDDLELYLKDIMRTFTNDTRVFAWDLYNEPSNSGKGEKSIALLKDAFKWAREVNPSQPLTSAPWNLLFMKTVNVQLENSDVLSFHNYGSIKSIEEEIDYLTSKEKGRPIFVSEYMARPLGSTIMTHLPWFVENKIAAINWGFVTGKTQTRFPWACTREKPCKEEELKLWFHDITYSNGTSYKTEETELIKKLSKSQNY